MHSKVNRRERTLSSKLEELPKGKWITAQISLSRSKDTLLLGAFVGPVALVLVFVEGVAPVLALVEGVAVSGVVVVSTARPV